MLELEQIEEFDPDGINDVDFDRLHNEYLFENMSELEELDLPFIDLEEPVKSCKQLTECANYNKYVPLDFGLANKNLNWKLGRFIDIDLISGLDLNESQIDCLASILNWDILSTKKLSGVLFVKHHDKINWSVFLQNNHPKQTRYLSKVSKYIWQNADLFHKPRIKNQYYNNIFIRQFPNIIDWKWLVKHKQVSDVCLLDYWHKFKPDWIAKYQQITSLIAMVKKSQLNWTIVCNNQKLTEKVIEISEPYICWNLICKTQTHLPESFFSKHINKINLCILLEFKLLSEEFINKYLNKMSFHILCRCQYLTVDFVKTHADKIYWDLLFKNKNYNKKDSIQVLRNDNTYVVLDKSNIYVRFMLSPIYTNV